MYFLQCSFPVLLRLSMNTTSPSTTEWSYQPGVDIRIPDWGYTTAFETLDPSTPSVEPYFVDLVNAFLEQGYRENVSLRGVPYDWRLTPSKCHGIFSACPFISLRVFFFLSSIWIRKGKMVFIWCLFHPQKLGSWLFLPSLNMAIVVKRQLVESPTFCGDLFKI